MAGLERLAEEPGMTLHEIADVLRALPQVTQSHLSTSEADVLRSLGVDPREATRGSVCCTAAACRSRRYGCPRSPMCSLATRRGSASD